VFRLLADFVCLLTYEFCLFFWKIAQCSVILLLPLLIKMNVKVIWNAKIIIFSFLKILIYVKIKYIKNVSHSLFESYDIWFRRKRHFILSSIILATRTIMQIICYWPQIWTHSVEIVCMLRYSVDEENVGGKEIEARSEV
jgi:hypothetical protein